MSIFRQVVKYQLLIFQQQITLFSTSKKNILHIYLKNVPVKKTFKRFFFQMRPTCQAYLVSLVDAVNELLRGRIPREADGR